MMPEHDLRGKGPRKRITTVLFLGGGRITSAVLAGLRLAKHDYRLLVHDRHPEKLRNLKKTYSVIVEKDLSRAIEKADILIIAVRPDAIRSLLETVRRSLAGFKTASSRRRQPQLAISLAAGVLLNTLRKGMGDVLKFGRAMPSPLCRFGRGLTAVTFPRDASRAHQKFVRDFFGATGNVIEIPENKFDAFTVTYSCSHGYHALETLAKSAQAAGLDRKTALLASAHALADGIFAWREGKISLERLIEEAATPGGIAATTMTGMDFAGYGRAVRQGVVEGLRRARANARG
jgi:pyrroline-5-carboxylate reductase